MDWLNYHHLLYFWVVAREGSIARASKQLLLAQPTISGQIRALEDSLGDKLFTRVGRNLVLTEFGRVVFRHAEEIFTLGRELMDVVKGRSSGRPLRLHVGVADVLPKIVVYRLLAPALLIGEPLQLVCHEDKPDRLMASLATHELDVVLSDSPAPPATRVKVYNHLLGSCGVSFFATAALAKQYRRGFPRGLEGAPLLMPSESSVLRRALEQWLDSHGIRVKIAGEFQDSALMKAFGQAGMGIFTAPSVIEDEVRRNYGVQLLGATEEITERFYAISAERKFKHPAVAAISSVAREQLFAQNGRQAPAQS